MSRACLQKRENNDNDNDNEMEMDKEPNIRFKENIDYLSDNNRNTNYNDKIVLPLQ